jgi:hypothetical protein
MYSSGIIIHFSRLSPFFFMLEIELIWNDSSVQVLLTQNELIETLAKQHRIVGVRASMPSAPHYCSMEPGSQPTNKMKYQQIAGGLLFLSKMMKPEATVQVNLLGRRATNPSAVNMEGAKELLLYFFLIKEEEI